jgi:hypothetical protein
MTKAEAATLRKKWKLQVDPLSCEHPSQELEVSERGYLTGNYHCTDCGEPVSKNL